MDPRQLSHIPGMAGANRLSRRRFVGGTATIGLAAAAAGLVGCSSSNKSNNNTGAKATTAPSVAAQASSTAAGLSTAAAGGTATRAAATAPAAVSPAAAATLDSTKGKNGGTLKYIYSGAPTTLTLYSTRPVCRSISQTLLGELASTVA